MGGEIGVGVRTLRLRQVSRGIIYACFPSREFKHRRFVAPGSPGNSRSSGDRGIAMGELRMLDLKRLGLRLGGRRRAWASEDIKIAWRNLTGETFSADGHISATKFAW